MFIHVEGHKQLPHHFVHTHHVQLVCYNYMNLYVHVVILQCATRAWLMVIPFNVVSSCVYYSHHELL